MIDNPLAVILDFARQLLSAWPIVLAVIATLIVTWFLAKIVGWLVHSIAGRSRIRQSLQELLQNLTAIGVWALGLMAAMTIAFPEMSPTDMVAALGFGSIAIGFAFKDVFENFIAGLLVLYREPMRIGDHIHCDGIEGKVERISIRDTHIRQTDGQLVVLPNAMLFKNPVEIRTDLEIRRQTIIVGVAYDTDTAKARSVLEAAFEGLESIEDLKPIQIYAQSFNASSIDYEVTWWCGSTPLAIRRSRDEVIHAVKRALDDAGIEIPFPQRTLSFLEPLNVNYHEKEMLA